jgi:hypothetical protein
MKPEFPSRAWSSVGGKLKEGYFSILNAPVFREPASLLRRSKFIAQPETISTGLTSVGRQMELVTRAKGRQWR